MGEGGGVVGAEVRQQLGMRQSMSWQGILVQCDLRILKGPHNISSEAEKIVDFFFKRFRRVWWLG